MQKLADILPSRIREMRIARKWTLEDLAEKTGSTFSEIGKIERSSRKLNLEWIDRFAAAFEMSPQEFFANAGSKTTAPQLKQIPLVGKIAAGNWREAIQDPMGWVPAMEGSANAFALTPDGDSMNLIVPAGGYVVVDPDQFELLDGKVYAVMNGDGETTFKRFRAGPPRLEPCSSNPVHQPIALGREPFTVVGRITGAFSPL